MKRVIVCSLIALFAFLLLSSTTPPPTETPTPTIPPTPTPTPTTASAPLDFGATPVPLIAVIAGCVPIFAFVSSFSKNATKETRKKWHVWMIFGFLFLLYVGFAFFGIIVIRDLSYLVAGVILVIALAVGVVYFLVASGEENKEGPTELDSIIRIFDTLKENTKEISNLNNINTRLEGDLKVAQSELIREQGDHLITKSKSGILQQQIEELSLTLKKKEKELAFEMYRSDSLDEVDSHSAVIDAALYNKDYKGVLGGIRITLEDYVAKPIYGFVANSLKSILLPLDKLSFTLFMVVDKDTEGVCRGFEVLSTRPVFSTEHVQKIEANFCWNNSSPDDSGTVGIASKCAKLTEEKFQFIPNLEKMTDDEAAVWADIVDGEKTGALLSVPMRIPLMSESGKTHVETFGVINITFPLSRVVKGGTISATDDEIDYLINEISRYTMLYSPNVCSLIAIYKYVRSIQEL